MSSNDDKELIDITDLKNALMEIEFFEEFDSQPSGDKIYHLVGRLNNLKLKVYQEKGHVKPHIHIDIGQQTHVASYGIDPPVCLAGSLGRKQDRVVLNWIELKKLKLLEIWKTVDSGKDPRLLIAAL